MEELAHDVEIFKIRTTPLQDNPPESLNAISIQIKENERMLAHLHARWAREADRKSTRLNSSHSGESRMPSSA